MTRYLTDDECGRIVRASINPDRVLGGPDGHEGSRPDVLLTTVERIVRRHRADTLRETADSIHTIGVPEHYDAPQYREGLIDGYGLSAAHARVLADRIEATDD